MTPSTQSLFSDAVLYYYYPMRTNVAQESIQAAVELLVKQYQPEAVLLYGSRAKDNTHTGSDVDIAILLNRQSLPDNFKLAQTQTELEALLKKDVDLVVLDSVSPILAMEILRNHQVLYQISSDILNYFTVKVTGEYFDLKYSRRPIEQQLLAS